MKTRIGLTLATFGLLLLIQPVNAEPSMGSMAMSMGHGHGGHHMDAMGGGDSHFMMLLKSANLTPAQHAQVRDILTSEKAKMGSVYEGVHAVHQQIAGRLLAAGPVTAADLAPLAQKMARYQEQIDRDMIDTAVAIRNVLTPEQVSRLAQVHQQLQNLHEQIRSLLGPEADEPPDQSN